MAIKFVLVEIVLVETVLVGDPLYCLLMSSTIPTYYTLLLERIPYVQNKFTVASMEGKVKTERFNKK
jgi:hypothetical protein